MSVVFYRLRYRLQVVERSRLRFGLKQMVLQYLQHGECQRFTVKHLIAVTKSHIVQFAPNFSDYFA